MSQLERTEVEFSSDDEGVKESSKVNNLCLLFILVGAVAIFSLAIYSQIFATPQQPLQLQPTKVEQVIKNVPKEDPPYIQVSNILDFAPIQAGEIHFTRIPRDYWQHRLLTIKALGLNSLSVYIFWNFHEIKRGEFDFTTGERDLVGFLQLSAKLGFKVLLRPGPYVCAEWDFGGLPARLLGIKNLTIRSHNQAYEEQVWLYFSALAEVIQPYLQINGGNIILLQIQNEFGSLNKDHKHTSALLNMWKRLNISVNFYYQDAFQNWQKHYWNGSSLGLSGGHNPLKSQYFEGRMILGGQIYTGWLTHWGEEWQGLDIKFVQHLEVLLKHNLSFSLYLIHGGSNFGLSAGANEFPDSKYMPHVTSYDYGCPINEQGSINAKYTAAKQMLKKYNVTQSIPVPDPIKTISIPPITLKVQANLMANLPSPISIPELTFFQNETIAMYDQGIVIYETYLPAKKNYTLKVMAHDYALFFVDGEHQGGSLRRERYEQRTVKVQCKKEGCVLRILVQAMGHVNYGQMQRMDRKGLVHFEAQGEKIDFKWKVYRMPLNGTAPINWNNIDDKLGYPKLLSGTFKLAELGDTYFKMGKFGKGYLWVNGKLLGRYWKIGPQNRVFCPGVWLKKGENQIHVLELDSTVQTSIQSGKNLMND